MVCLALLVGFTLALARTAARADEPTERLLTAQSREQARALRSLVASVTIEARRVQAREAAGRLSRHRTWRQPSSA